MRGLEALAKTPPTHVLIHDGARAFVSKALIVDIIGALRSGPAVIPGLPVQDTVKRVDADNVIAATLARGPLRLVQTPQAFDFDIILDAHRRAKAQHISGLTDDAAIAEWAGVQVRIIEGDPANRKITTAEDFEHAERQLMLNYSDIRIGQGYDVHALVEGDHVWLGGVKIPHHARLSGHSDADVLIHALVDAILGALGDGDIGVHFPPSDNQWRGAPSRVFLEFAVARVAARGGLIAHLDGTLVCEGPKIGPYREEIRAKIAEIANISLDRVGLKATTSEKLGFLGRSEDMNLTEKAKKLLKAYAEAGLTLATAESCTGGLVAASLTEIAGSSVVVDCGFVTYSNAAKSRMLGVPAALIAEKGAVSVEVAQAMADGVLANSDADVAVSITGIAGPGGDSALKPVGLVCFAVDRLDLTIYPGELYALLGPNGAGKTTTLRMVAGLTTPDSGEISVFGINTRTDPIAAKRLIAWVPDEPLLYDKLTPLEYLEFIAGLWNVPTHESEPRAAELLQLLGLWEQRNTRCEGFSRGMKQKAALAGALIHEPRLLILDEPLTGLDASAARQVKDLLQSRAKAGATIILTTHILEVAERLADRIGIIQAGKLRAEGTMSQLRHLIGGEAADGFSLEQVFLELALSLTAQAMFARGDADLLLTAPMSMRKILTIRALALSVPVIFSWSFIILPLMNLMAVLEHWHWLLAYPVMICLGLAATGLGLLITIGLFQMIGPARTRTVAQILSVIVGAIAFIVLQARVLLPESWVDALSRSFASISDPAHFDKNAQQWLAARALFGDMTALSILTVGTVSLFVVAVWIFGGSYATQMAALAGASQRAKPKNFIQTQAKAFRTGANISLLRKEWRLLIRDPWLISHILLQLLYILPMGVLFWRTTTYEGNSSAGIAPMLVMLSAQLAGGLAWITISGEDAPDLVAAAPH
eukprot:gene6343-biopygen3977